MKFPDRGGRWTGTGGDPGRGSHHLAQPRELGLHHGLVSAPGLRHILTGEEDHKETDQREEPEHQVPRHARLQLGENCPHCQHLEVGQSHCQPSHHNSHLKQTQSQIIHSPAKHVTRPSQPSKQAISCELCSLLSLSSGIFKKIIIELMTKISG